MQILQANSFKKTIKKLHPNQKQLLDRAIKQIAENPICASDKKGDLRGIRVCRFHMLNQLTLAAHQYDEDQKIISLLALGSHENFYPDLKHNFD
jgi:mRNA-degrading endonuclease RelE of RelBE toxin-antitoxin system